MLASIDNSDIKIEVQISEIKSQMGGANKFQVYSVKGEDSHGNIDILRRYSDFTLLREVLVKRWPGCFVTTLPQKKTIGSNESLFIENRRRGLEQFLKALSKSSYLWESDQAQLFFRNTSGDSDKVISALTKQGSDRILARYSTTFSEYKKIEITSELIGKEEQFAAYLKQIVPMLDSFNELAENMGNHMRKFNEKYLNFFDILLPEYETNALFQINELKKKDHLILANGKENGILDLVNKFKDTSKYHNINRIIEEVKREKREVEGFHQAIRIKDEFQAERQKSIAKTKDLQIQAAKINAGKESIFAKITNKSKEDQLKVNQQHLQAAKTEQKMHTELCQLIRVLLITNQIDKFKTMRQAAYYNLLKEYMLCEKAQTQLQKQIWICIGKQDQVKLDINEGLKYESKEKPVEKDQFNEQLQFNKHSQEETKEPHRVENQQDF